MRRTFDERALTVHELKQLGIGSKLPPLVKRSFNRLAEREAAWARASQGKRSGTREWTVARYNADLQLLQRWGYLKPDQVKRAQEWAAHAPLDDVRKARAALSSQGGFYDKEFRPARETQKWTDAQASYGHELERAVKEGLLTVTQARRGRAWARQAHAKDIDQARLVLERKEVAPTA